MASGDAAPGRGVGSTGTGSAGGMGTGGFAGAFGEAGDMRVLAIGAGQVAPVVDVLRAAGFHVDECRDGSTGYDGYSVVLMDPNAHLTFSTSSLAPTAADVLGIDAHQRSITVDGHPLALTAREYALLAYLMASPRRVFTRDELMRDVWGSTWRTDGIVTEYIRRLRGHLGDHGLAGCLVTRHGFGYSYNPDAPVMLD